MIPFLADSPLKEPLIFDSHAHYDDKKFDGIRDELLSALPAHGVERVITCGCDTASSKAALTLSEKYGYIYAAAGIHPGNLGSHSLISDIEKLASYEKCVAIGEIGLDYYWVNDNKPLQRQVFEDQIILAKKLDLPVIVHDRDAHTDTLELLLKHKPKGVLHCYSGSAESAKRILDIGMYIGVGGVVTFKNAKKLPEVISVIPDDRLMIETDCPYLAPEPFRGKTCHSGMIALTAERIAEIRGTSRDEILRLTSKNAHFLFNI